MVETLSLTIRTARKNHVDSAGIWIRVALSYLRSSGELSFSELRSIAKLKSKDWKILVGDKYEDCVCKQDGKLYSFKCNHEINAICQKLNMYDDC